MENYIYSSCLNFAIIPVKPNFQHHLNEFVFTKTANNFWFPNQSDFFPQYFYETSAEFDHALVKRNFFHGKKEFIPHCLKISPFCTPHPNHSSDVIYHHGVPVLYQSLDKGESKSCILILYPFIALLITEWSRICIFNPDFFFGLEIYIFNFLLQVHTCCIYEQTL